MSEASRRAEIMHLIADTPKAGKAEPWPDVADAVLRYMDTAIARAVEGERGRIKSEVEQIKADCDCSNVHRRESGLMHLDLVLRALRAPGEKA